MGQYLDYKNCVSRKSVTDRLVEECVNIVDEDDMQNKTINYLDDCSFSTLYIVLFAVLLSICLIISGVFIYFHWYRDKHLNLKNVSDVKYSKSETIIY